MQDGDWFFMWPRASSDSCFISFWMSMYWTDFSRPQIRSPRHRGGGDMKHHASELPTHLRVDSAHSLGQRLQG